MELEKADPSKKNAILQTTLQLISKEGFDAVTIRKIAKHAEVNVALVNYYFGSKNKLLNEALKVILSSLKDAFILLENKELDPKARIKQFLIQYVAVYQAYPSIRYLFLDQSTYEFDSQKDYMNFIRSLGLEKLGQTIREITGEPDERKCMVMVSQLLGATFLPMIIAPMVKDATTFQLPDPEKHVELLLDHYFNRYQQFL